MLTGSLITYNFMRRFYRTDAMGWIRPLSIGHTSNLPGNRQRNEWKLIYRPMIRQIEKASHPVILEQILGCMCTVRDCHTEYGLVTFGHLPMNNPNAFSLLQFDKN